jgi:hypothetical protein
MNLLVEDWGGKYQLKISLQSGNWCKELLEKVIRSEVLD